MSNKPKTQKVLPGIIGVSIVAISIYLISTASSFWSLSNIFIYPILLIAVLSELYLVFPQWKRIVLVIAGITIIIISGFIFYIGIYMAVYDHSYFWSMWNIFTYISLIAACGGLSFVFPQLKSVLIYIASALIIIPCVVYAIYVMVAWTKYDLIWILYGVILLIIAGATVMFASSKLSTKYHNRFLKRSLSVVLCAVLGSIVFISIVYIDFDHLLDRYEYGSAYIAFDGETDCYAVYSALEKNGYYVQAEYNKVEDDPFDHDQLYFHYKEDHDYGEWYEEDRYNSPYKSGAVQCRNYYYDDIFISISYRPQTNIGTYLKRQEAERWLNEESEKIAEIVESETELVHTKITVYDEWDYWD